MSVQRTRWLLRAGAATLLVSSIVVVAWAFQDPSAAADEAATPVAVRRQQAQLVRSPPLEEFAKVWRKELRRPLYDPPPPPQEEQPKEKKDPSRKKNRRGNAERQGGLQLVGTMVEGGRSLAIFTDASGKIDLKGVGETLELSPDKRVESIEFAQVTISEQGRPTVLRVPNSKAP